MNLDYSPEQIEFREKARAWLAANVPKEKRPADSKAAGAFDRMWQRTLFDGGWAGLNWPKEYGGCGLSGMQMMIWFEECARAQAPTMGSTNIGLMHGGPTLIARGNEEQKAFHLPKILKGEAVWCQGFSEPEAGSDLANLKCRGVIEGDEMVVNGTKMWTSHGHYADFQELLIRTEADSKRHKGLSWLICDMRSPGIDIKPIKTMMGESHVNMVFYDNVRIPLTNVVGGLGNGWSVAMSTFSFERGITFLPDQIDLLEKVERVIQMARKIRLETGQLAIEDREICRRLGRIKADTLALRAMTISSMSRIDRDGAPGSESSLMKLFVTNTWKTLSEVAAEIIGWNFLEYGEERTSNIWAFEYLWSWVLTIAGGSSEIQREVVADRLLQLPRSR